MKLCDINYTIVFSPEMLHYVRPFKKYSTGVCMVTHISHLKCNIFYSSPEQLRQFILELKFNIQILVESVQGL